MIKRRINIQSQLDTVNQAAAQALASAQSAIAVSQGSTTQRPLVRPSFSIDFSNTRFIDPKIQFSRNSIGTYFDKSGIMRLASANKPRFTHDPITKQCLGIYNESKKTNYLLRSTDIVGYSAIWQRQRINPVYSTTVKGVFNPFATKLVCDGNPDPMLYQAIQKPIAGKPFVFSIYVWTDQAPTKATLRIHGASTEELKSSIVNVTNIPTKVEVSTTFSNTAVSQILFGRIDPFEGETETPIAGSYIYVDAPQLEDGLTSSSYIPTYEIPQTREKELIGVSGSSFKDFFPNITEGTIQISAYKGYGNGAYPSYFSFQGDSTSGGQNQIRLTQLLADKSLGAVIYKDGGLQFNVGYSIDIGNEFTNLMAWNKTSTKSILNGIMSADTQTVIPDNIDRLVMEDVNGIVKQIAFWPSKLSDIEMQALCSNGLSGKKGNQVPSNSDLGGMAYMSPYSILRSNNRQHFTVDGTGTSITRNIRFNFDFDFEIVDSSGCSITSQPSASCLANTDNALVFSAPQGKSLTYAIIPKFEY